MSKKVIYTAQIALEMDLPEIDGDVNLIVCESITKKHLFNTILSELSNEFTDFRIVKSKAELI